MIGIQSIMYINGDVLRVYANLNLLLREAPENSAIRFSLIQACMKAEELYKFLKSFENIKVEGGNLYTFDPTLPPRTYA